MNERSFLFLQGPYGPFFQELGETLAHIGHHVNRINFNTGDYYDWNGPLTTSFRGSMQEWPDFLVNCLEKFQVTDLILFNDSRPLHRTALAALKNMELRRWVFEEGYLRPYWVTLELGGVNGNSPLPRKPNWFLTHPQNKFFPKEKEFKFINRATQVYKLRYYMLERIGRRNYPHYKYHREFGGKREILGNLRSMLRKPYDKKRSDIVTDQILNSKKPFFMLCLQIDHDTQIKIHSPYHDMRDVLMDVCSSFAASAPPDTLLLVKNHPLNNGKYNHRANTIAAAKLYDISDRVVYIEYGNLSELLRAAQGTIVVNSTVGQSALLHNCPVIALGKAVYNMNGLTHQNGLESFWTQPQPPDKELVKAYRTVLANTVCINGCYFTKIGRKSLLPLTVDRLLNGTR